MKSKLPKTIDEYEVRGVLGRGGMGTVYLCHDPELQRPVAVKMLKLSGPGLSLEARKIRFLREAVTTAQLQHPALPPVYTVREMEDGHVYYVMKPIDGRPLDTILDDLRLQDDKIREEFDLFRLIEILRDVCRALEFAHSRGILHRDLKPSNIFVGDFGEVYVIDWGLTKALREGSEKKSVNTGTVRPKRKTDSPSPHHNVTTTDSTIAQPIQAVVNHPGHHTVDLSNTLTLDGDILGTLAYMPPEQAAGRVDELGPEADIYAMGVILYEMITYELPVDETDFSKMLARKEAGDFPLPEYLAPSREIPPELSAITMQAMHPDPERRFRTAVDFNKALEFWLEGKSQFRLAISSLPEPAKLQVYPKSTRRSWAFSPESMLTGDPGPTLESYLLFPREFTGDVRFSTHVIAMPQNDSDRTISEIALVINAALPTKGENESYLDCVSVHLAASNNTRAYLCRNDSELVSNEYVVLESQKRYRVPIERTQDHIRVLLDRQVILFYEDRQPDPGLRVGILNLGPGIQYSGVRIHERAQPTMTRTSDIPEALMDEECYSAAYKRFMSIAQGHKNRFEGAWARYRAGIAIYKLHGDRKQALKVWRSLKSSPYIAFEFLGRAMLELEGDRPLKAAKILSNMLNAEENLLHLEPVADLAFARAQQVLRQKSGGEKNWKIIDAWSRLALILGQRVEGKTSITPSILWRWLLLSLTQYPRHLSGCIIFLRENFGKGQGEFAKVLTTIEPMMNILRRSASMTDHAYLMDKVMRLILSHEDTLGNLETLARFYLHAGHEEEALRISNHIYELCKQKKNPIPPMPIAFTACSEWLHGNRRKGRALFQTMVENSYDWGKADGMLLLGLDDYSRNDIDAAHQCWRSVEGSTEVMTWNRHLVAKGLLGLLPPNPVEAKVPQRSDHRLLYCLFVGYRYFLDWRRERTDDLQELASTLLKEAMSLLQPSYDIYSATSLFTRAPLEAMGHTLPPAKAVDPITPEEATWLKQLTAAAEQDDAHASTRSSSTRRKQLTPRKKNRGR